MLSCLPFFFHPLSIRSSFLTGSVRPFKALCLSLRHPFWSGPLFSAASAHPSANACSFSAVLSPPLCLRRRPELTSVAAKWQRGGQPRGGDSLLLLHHSHWWQMLCWALWSPPPKCTHEGGCGRVEGRGRGGGPGEAAALTSASFLSLHFYVTPLGQVFAQKFKITLALKRHSGTLFI